VDVLAEQKLDSQKNSVLTVSIHSGEIDITSLLQPKENNLQEEERTSKPIKHEVEKKAEIEQKAALIGTLLTKEILTQKQKRSVCNKCTVQSTC